jgi:hypothetical protein
MTGAEFIAMVDSLGLNDTGISCIAGLREPRMLAIVRAMPNEPLEVAPVFSQLGLDVIHALWRTVATIDGENEKRQLGDYLAHELHTHGAGHVAWKILNTYHRQPWTPEEIP